MTEAKQKVAIASENDNGLNSLVSSHFGHCPVFIMVELEANEIKNVSTLVNAPHQQGGCAAPIMLLKNSRVDTLIVGGMGMRPLMIAHNEGIKVYTGVSGTVSDAIKDLIDNKLYLMDEKHTCQH